MTIAKPSARAPGGNGPGSFGMLRNSGRDSTPGAAISQGVAFIVGVGRRGKRSVKVVPLASDERLAEELAAHGAPAHLVAAARSAAVEEALHAPRALIRSGRRARRRSLASSRNALASRLGTPGSCTMWIGTGGGAKASSSKRSFFWASGRST